MADEEKKEEIAEEESQGGGKKKLIILIVVVLLAVIVGLVIVTKFMGGSKEEEEEGKTDAKKSAKVVKKDDKKKKPIVPEKMFVSAPIEILVNPAGTKGTRFLKCTIVLRVENEAVVSEVADKQAMFTDEISSILGGLTLMDLDQFNVPDFEGKTLKDKIKKQIMEVINKNLQTGKVIAVYFKEFIVQ